MKKDPIRIAIVPNRTKDPSFEVTGKLAGFLKTYGARVVLESEVAQRLQCEDTHLSGDEIYKHCHIAIAIGGDGTMLQVARSASKSAIPVLGINLGHLGFLPEMEVGEMEDAAKALCRGEYRIESRMMLMAQVEGKPENTTYAVNDISITRGRLSRLLYIDAMLDGQAVGEFAADGVILSTPTGSTAYSLSAGGPVVYPGLDCILFTPICPHSLHRRPLILAPEEDIRIRIWDRESDIVLSIDGQHMTPLVSGDWVSISKAPYPVQFVRIKPKDFFGVLHTKFLGG